MRVLVVEDEVKMAGLYDAIVLDVMLPDLDGFEVCRRLRAGGNWAPVVMPAGTREPMTT